MNTSTNLQNQSVDRITEHLNGYLSDLFVLYVKTLNYHWNIEDPRFISLHQMLEDHYVFIQGAIDEVAERVRKLGRKVPASMQSFLNQTTQSESGVDFTANEMLADVADSHEMLVRKLREIIAVTDECGDPGTSDMLTAILRFHEKTVWMVRAQL